MPDTLTTHAMHAPDCTATALQEGEPDPSCGGCTAFAARFESPKAVEVARKPWEPPYSCLPCEHLHRAGTDVSDIEQYHARGHRDFPCPGCGVRCYTNAASGSTVMESALGRPHTCRTKLPGDLRDVVYAYGRSMARLARCEDHLIPACEAELTDARKALFARITGDEEDRILGRALREGRLAFWHNQDASGRAIPGQLLVQVKVGPEPHDIDGRTCKDVGEAIAYTLRTLKRWVAR